MNRTQRQALNRELRTVGNLPLERIAAVQIRDGDVLVVMPDPYPATEVERQALANQISLAFRGAQTVIMPKDWRLEVVHHDELPATER